MDLVGWYPVQMERKQTQSVSLPHTAGRAIPEGEIVTMLAPGDARLPRRR